MRTTVFIADILISSKRSFFEFTRGFRYMTRGSFVLTWKLETIMGKSCT